MKSLLYQPTIENPTPLRLPATCLLGREERSFTLPYRGKMLTFTVRNKTTVEDSYCSMVKAIAVAQWTVSAYGGVPPTRAMKDFLIKHDSII